MVIDSLHLHRIRLLGRWWKLRKQGLCVCLMHAHFDMDYVIAYSEELDPHGSIYRMYWKTLEECIEASEALAGIERKPVELWRPKFLEEKVG